MGGKLMRRSVIATFLLTVLVSALGSSAFGQCAAPPTLDGRWTANDGGFYDVRVVGNNVFWLGQSGDGGRSWTQVFHGTRQGNAITGMWADVRGASHNSGQMTLRVSGTASMEFVSGVRGAGMRWGRSCNDNVGVPR
jgi:hypothetical protein